MKKVLIGLLLTFLIFINCRRKSSNSITTTDHSDTTELPPAPPGNAIDSTTGKSSDTTTNQTVPKFTFLPQKQNLEAGNIGIGYKESNPNIFYVNIHGGNNVFGVTFDFDYDSIKLKIKSVTEGDFLKKDGAKTNILFTNPNVGISRSGSEIGSVSGSGVVCIIELEAKKTFDSLSIGFKNQAAKNDQGIKIPSLSDNNWFGGILNY